MIEYAQESLTDESWGKILTCSYDEDSTLVYNQFLVRKSWVALGGFIFNPEKTLLVLEELGQLDQIVKKMILHNEQYTDLFSIKVSLESKDKAFSPQTCLFSFLLLRIFIF